MPEQLRRFEHGLRDDHRELARHLDFSGTAGYVNFGDHRDAPHVADARGPGARRIGVGTRTGNVWDPDLVPIAKGRGRPRPDQDVNYIVGIRPRTVRWAQISRKRWRSVPEREPSVTGTTPLPPGVWHHLAATYDGT
jgi:hypothetical protein